MRQYLRRVKYPERYAFHSMLYSSTKLNHSFSDHFFIALQLESFLCAPRQTCLTHYTISANHHHYKISIHVICIYLFTYCRFENQEVESYPYKPYSRAKKDFYTLSHFSFDLSESRSSAQHFISTYQDCFTSHTSVVIGMPNRKYYSSQLNIFKLNRNHLTYIFSLFFAIYSMVFTFMSLFLASKI